MTYNTSFNTKIVDPIAFQQMMWPDVYMYDKQREIIYSVENNDETVVPAGNMLGKDFVAGHIALSYLCRYPVVRVVTSSVDQGQLEKVLWGEVNRWVETSVHELSLRVGHCDIRKIVGGKECPTSYLIGRVAAKEEGLLGHHAPFTLMIYDEGSGIPHGFKKKTDTWAKKTLIIGNPYPCDNFFRYAVQGHDPDNPSDAGGDVPKIEGEFFYRKIIKIIAEDSPNVKYGLSQISHGIVPNDEIVVSGVLSWKEYEKRRRLWDDRSKCVSLDAEFYSGADTLLYPVVWLNNAEQRAGQLVGKPRKAKSMGVDPAEGGDSTVWTIIDEHGIIEQVSMKTPETTIITSHTIAFMRKHNLSGRKVFFDSGGGGKQHADRLRQQGYKVQTVAFGGGTNQELKQTYTPFEERKKQSEVRYVYKNRRAQMYHMLRLLLDPSENPQGFGISRELVELKRQMAPIPLKYDNEGRIYMLPKNKVAGGPRRVTLTDLIGHSPDELDSTVLAVFGMNYKVLQTNVGAI